MSFSRKYKKSDNVYTEGIDVERLVYPIYLSVETPKPDLAAPTLISGDKRMSTRTSCKQSRRICTILVYFTYI